MALPTLSVNAFDHSRYEWIAMQAWLLQSSAPGDLAEGQVGQGLDDGGIPFNHIEFGMVEGRSGSLRQHPGHVFTGDIPNSVNLGANVTLPVGGVSVRRPGRTMVRQSLWRRWSSALPFASK